MANESWATECFRATPRSLTKEQNLLFSSMGYSSANQELFDRILFVFNYKLLLFGTTLERRVDQL
jgi:hypothetical protein